MKRIVFLTFFAFRLVSLEAQNQNDAQIAKQFYDQQEYEKSEILYRKLYEKEPSAYYSNYLSNLLALRRYDEAIQFVESHKKISNDKLLVHLDLGYIFLKKKDTTTSQKEWNKAIEMAVNDQEKAQFIYEYLIPYRQYEVLIRLIEAIQKKQKNNSILSRELISLYLNSGQFQKGAQLIIQKAETDSLDFNQFVYYIQNHSDNKSFLQILEKQIYTQLSKSPNSDLWNESAIWLSLQNKNYDEALDICKALMKRKSENGYRVLYISDLSFQDEQYEVALEGYRYLIAQKDRSLYFHQAYYKKFLSFYSMIEKSAQRDSVKVLALKAEFYEYFKENPASHQNAETQLLFAKFKYRYENQADSAIFILEHLIQLPSIKKNEISLAKLELGDLYVIKGDEWEAALLYGQVDADEKDSPLGELARFKNAKLFYYKGDFELAQDLFSILKSATSELIANDALEISVFIQDNLNDDSLNLGMKKMAESELFFLQNKPNQAFKILSEIQNNKNYNDLLDDIYFLKAKYLIQYQSFDEALLLLDSLIIKFPRSILADNAFFMSGKILEEQKQDFEKAKEQYMQILLKYKDSIFTSESRKRLRKLRGELQDEQL